MGRPWFFCSSFIHIHFFFFFVFSATDTAYGRNCREDQRSALLHLQQTLKFNPLQSSKLISWNNWSTQADCCTWRGVTCNKNGSIIGLDLKAEGIYGGLDNSSSLFNLQQLKNLSLGVNSFSAPIPASISRLVNLEHLDFYNSGFIGQVPLEISHLTKLLNLDLSCSLYGNLELQRPNLTALVSNLSLLQVLRLDGINISYLGMEWSNVLSSSLPNLRILSLSNCNLLGPPDVSLLRLKYLSEIMLDANNFSAPFPEFFVHFANLESLILAYCEIHGKVPEKLFHLQSLVHLDVSENALLRGTLPDFPQNMSLQTLILGGTNMSGDLPYSIGSLHNLSFLDLSTCNFTGVIPFSVENLSQLQYLDLSHNMLTGFIPNFSNLMNLAQLKLSHNSLVGGLVPSLFTLPFLQTLLLPFNQFSGLLHEFPNASSSPLVTIDFSSNKLEGPIPLSIYNLQNLTVLDLSFNNFNGTVEVTNLQRLQGLAHLDLSYNRLSFSPSTSNFTLLPPSISQLKLASCNLTMFPTLRNHEGMYNLDLSNNRIQGEIPNWIWNVGTVNLSQNLLSSFEMPFPDHDLISTSSVVDLHSNMLTGPLPKVHYSAAYIDYSYNNFNSTIPTDIGNYLALTIYFSLSHNELVGGLPLSMCNASYLLVLDLSYNSLDGEIPSCLFNMSIDLGVLNLSGNKLKGHIPETFSSDCALKTLALNDNMLEGQVPRSLMNCTGLDVLNLGKNQINDKFPCWLMSFSNLRVLVLRSNKLHGSMNRCSNTTNMWKSLQILDLAHNNFSGDLPLEYVSSWKAMSDANEEEEEEEATHLRFEILPISQLYYIDKVAVISKGQQLELVKILTIFTSIDLSSNMFQGVIPSEIGQLTALYNLNISNNALTGQIPSSLGNLKQLGSMDLSGNKLTGYIPKELEKLTFLSYLNLSSNDLKGAIPQGSQFQTFTEGSFLGNRDLCGLPLSVRCRDDDDELWGPPAKESPDEAKGKFSGSGVKITWGDVVVSAEVGFFFGLWITVVPLLICRRWWKYFSWQIDKALTKVFGMHPPPSSSVVRLHRR